MRKLSTPSRLRSLGIGGRMAVAGALVAIVAALAVALLLTALGDLRSSARLSLETQQLLAAASRLETLTLQLQSGQRGYVLTGDATFLRSYDDAARELEDATLRFEALAFERADQNASIPRLATAIRSYYTVWSGPLVRLAARDLSAARARVETRRGELLVVRIRRQFEELAAAEEIVAASREAQAQADGRRAAFIAVAALIALVALLAVIVAYFVRVVVVPVRRIDLAAHQRATGNLALRVAPVGVGEARRLVESFNEMADANARMFSDLAHRRAELEAVLDSAVEAIAMADRDGNVVFTNGRMDALWVDLGVEVKGGIWDRLAALAARTGELERHAAAFAEVAANDRFVYESRFDLPDLGRSFVGHTGPVQRSDGFVVGRIFTLRETTAERAAERAKEEFLATVSHELRTPLTSIRGYLELVRDGEVGEVTKEQDRFLGIVDRSAQHLGRLVEDLLVVGRTSEGRLDFEPAEVDLAEIARDCVEVASNAAEEKRIALRLDAEPDLILQGDRRRLTQLLTNLVGNAIKFTPAGGHVDVSARAKADAVVLVVTDDGIGVLPEERDRLFERFFRASSAAVAQVPGTGLGLAISKAIVEAHGGTIDVSSSQDGGTTFRVELPRGGLIGER